MRTVVVLGILALVSGYALGNVFWFNAGERPVAPSAPTSPTANGIPSDPSESSTDVAVAYTGDVVAQRAVTAISSCENGSDAGGLLRNDSRSIWRCPGDGLSETLQFTIDASRPLVGVRLINGNVSDEGRYHAERRILTVQWTLTDERESRFEQGLGGNDPAPQEIRFPPTTVSGISLTIRESTPPGDPSDGANAVSIAGVEFLYPGDPDE